MQQETPQRKRKTVNRTTKVPAAKRVAKRSKIGNTVKVQGSKSMALNNPYQNVPVKTNNLPSSGFNFPGAIV